jgi:hypothetical protein
MVRSLTAEPQYALFRLPDLPGPQEEIGGIAFFQRAAYSEHVAVHMRIPDDIQVVISAGGQPLAQMLVALTFATSKKNSFHFAFGPSDAHGNIRVNRAQILAEAQKDREFFLMDYAELEGAWTGSLVVTPMNREAIGRARSAFQRFHPHYPYREYYKENLDVADAALAQIPNMELTASVLCSSSENIRIETLGVTAT